MITRKYYAEAKLNDAVRRYDIHGKRLLETNRKIYFGAKLTKSLIAPNNTVKRKR